jgi:2,5-dioxopentanoate dehydrogenase
MDIHGKSLLGFQEASRSDESFRAWNPAAAEKLEPPFFSATKEQVDRAAELSDAAFPIYGKVSHKARAAFLRSIASRIEALTEQLVERAHLETALPRPRLVSETGRTCGQLRLFASVVEEASWVMARIDRADPQRKPAPKPDIR